MIEIRWHGRGGQGAFTASKILGDAAIKLGNYAMAFPAFGPERRGAPIQAFTKISKEPIQNRSSIKKCDYIIVLDDSLFSPSLLEDLKEGGKLLINTSQEEKYKAYTKVIALEGNLLAQEIFKRPVVNTLMLGALTVLDDEITLQALEASLADFLPEKLVEKNRQAIERASYAMRAKRSNV